MTKQTDKIEAAWRARNNLIATANLIITEAQERYAEMQEPLRRELKQRGMEVCESKGFIACLLELENNLSAAGKRARAMRNEANQNFEQAAREVYGDETIVEYLLRGDYGTKVAHGATEKAAANSCHVSRTVWKSN